jgi:hypothetical protein
VPVLFPRDVSAQPLDRLREPFDSPERLVELKLDGFRALAYCARGGGALISRRALC